MKEQTHPHSLQPITHEEIDRIENPDFKKFLTTLGENTEMYDEDVYNLNATLHNMSPFLLPFYRVDIEENDYRLNNRLTVLKRFDCIKTERRGNNNLKVSVCDREDLLLSFSYLYVHHRHTSKPGLWDKMTLEDSLREASSLWGEDPIAEHIKGSIESMHVKRGQGKLSRERKQTPLQAGVEKRIFPKPEITDELAQKLNEIDSEWVEREYKKIDGLIKKNLKKEFSSTVEWGEEWPDRNVGEVIEFIRRVITGKYSVWPLSKVFLGEWKDALEIVMKYFDTMKDKDPSLERLARYSLKKHEEPKARR